MSDKTDSVLEDIAFMKALAEAGRKRTLLGGDLLIISGLLFGGASFFHWAFVAKLIPVTWVAVDIVWATVSILFAVIVITYNVRNRTREPSAGRSARIGMSFAVYVLLFVFAYGMYKLQNGAVMELFCASIFALYGSYWMFAASVSGNGKLRWVGALSFAVSIAIALLLTNPHVYLLNAVALVAVSAIPGVMLRREAAKA